MLLLKPEVLNGEPDAVIRQTFGLSLLNSALLVVNRRVHNESVLEIVCMRKQLGVERKGNL